MTTLVLLVLVSLGVIFLWALLAPRNQWRVLVSWSHSDPRRTEPSGSAYLLYRLAALLGIAAMIVSGLLAVRSYDENRPQPPAPLTQIERMWGTPAPLVVNRVIRSVSKVPAGLVDQPVLGYQEVSGRTRQPSYLFSLETFSSPLATEQNGYLGTEPGPGLVALDTAQLVVRVAGDPACFPHAVRVVEGSSSVRIGVYYGRPNPPHGSTVEDLSDCNTKASGMNVPVLLPIQLSDILGGREVLTLRGDPIRLVEPIDLQ